MMVGSFLHNRGHYHVGLLMLLSLSIGLLLLNRFDDPLGNSFSFLDTIVMDGKNNKDTQSINPYSQSSSSFSHRRSSLRSSSTMSRNLGLTSAYSSLWTQNMSPDTDRYIIPVYMDPISLDDDAQNEIRRNLNWLMNRSGVIEFQIRKKKPTGWADYLLFVGDDEGCWSWIGKISTAKKGQVVSLSEPGCLSSRLIQHETLHSLGFYHEQSRPDRDRYIRIVWTNIREGKERNFEKVEGIDSLGTRYDYESVLHYSPFAYAIDKNEPTMESLRADEPIVKSKQASSGDIVQLQLLYQCDTSVGPRTYDEYKSEPCNDSCKCWEDKQGCGTSDDYCKGSLVCQANTCVKPETVADPPIVNACSIDYPEVEQINKYEIVKGGSVTANVDGYVFTLQAKGVSPLLIHGFNLGVIDKKTTINVYTKKGDLLVDEGCDWELIGSAEDIQSEDEDFVFTKMKDQYIPTWFKRSFKVTSTEPDALVALKNSLPSSKIHYQDPLVRVYEGCSIDDENRCTSASGIASYNNWGVKYSTAT